MSKLEIALVGGGPRALVMLNALYHGLTPILTANDVVEITVVDPRPGGTGCHDPNQPHYLFTNTLASQVTAFHPAATKEEAEGWITGPSFTEWAARTGTRNCEGYFRYSEGGTPICELDYLPRSLLGQYLSWAFKTIVATFPSNILVQQRHALAQSIEKRDDKYLVRLDDASVLTADCLFLATGHSTNCLSEADERLRDFAVSARSHNPHAGYYSQCYPVANLERIASMATVAIQGFGLTAWDALAELTEGRGGRYVLRDNHTVYLPSGKEPSIFLYSRNCLPSAARGINQKGLTGKHQAQYFTPQAVTQLRQAKVEETGSRQFDFKKEILPLLLKEMAFAYRNSEFDRQFDPTTFTPTQNELLAIDRIFNPFADRKFHDLSDYKLAFLEHVRDDLQEADRGNLAAPTKSATDVIRDCRNAICAAVEFRGLTPESEKWFRAEFVPVMNRVAFGPPKFRNHQLLALFEAGVVDLAAGPDNTLTTDPTSGKFVIHSQHERASNSVSADVIIAARLDPFLPEHDNNPIIQSLLSTGLVRPYRNGDYLPGGFDVDDSYRPIGSNGKPVEHMWITGLMFEGPTFYTHALPRTALPSGQHKIAAQCVSQMLNELRDHQLMKPREAAE